MSGAFNCWISSFSLEEFHIFLILGGRVDHSIGRIGVDSLSPLIQDTEVVAIFPAFQNCFFGVPPFVCSCQKRVADAGILGIFPEIVEFLRIIPKVEQSRWQVLLVCIGSQLP